MKQYGFYFDSDRCTGCKTCELACKDYKDLGTDVNFRRIYEYTGGTWNQQSDGCWHQDVFAYYMSISCNHCANPACTAVCPTGAMHKNEDGFVIVNEETCIGCRYCHMACPYDAPQYDAQKGHMTKCDGCYSRVKAGQKLGKNQFVLMLVHCVLLILHRLMSCELNTATKPPLRRYHQQRLLIQI